MSVSLSGMECQPTRSHHADRGDAEQSPRVCCPSGQLIGLLSQDIPFSAQESSLGPYLSSTWKSPGLFTALQAPVSLGLKILLPFLMPFLFSLGESCRGARVFTKLCCIVGTQADSG